MKLQKVRMPKKPSLMILYLYLVHLHSTKYNKIDYLEGKWWLPFHTPHLDKLHISSTYVRDGKPIVNYMLGIMKLDDVGSVDIFN